MPIYPRCLRGLGRDSFHHARPQVHAEWAVAGSEPHDPALKVRASHLMFALPLVKLLLSLLMNVGYGEYMTKR